MSVPIDGAVAGPGHDLDQPLLLKPLVYLEEGDEVTIGSPDGESYAVFPAEGAELVRMLADGITPREAAARHEEAHGESVDMPDLLSVLEDLGFVHDGTTALPPEPAPVRWQRLGKALFSRPAWACYALLVVLAVVEMARHPELAPHRSVLFFTSSYTAISLTIFLGQMPFLALHEGFHALAGRRLGLNSRFSVGRRLVYVVFETSLPGLIAVPRRQRYLPILAGMVADVLAMAGLTLVAAAVREPDGPQPLVGRVCLALAFAVGLRLLWQLFFYLRTDVYVLLTTVLGCNDLHAAAAAVLRDAVRRWTGRTRVDLSAFGPADLRVARWYAWLLPVGYALTLASFATVLLPSAYQMLDGLYGRLRGGGPVSGILDSATLVSLLVAQLLAVAVMAHRDRRARRLGAQQRA
ncbi:hypothetical protein [Streptacidiphilus rugosus]|uniref:hypothetical protein n=1 Tax=Streptacidiphilus rugosus TaxID=405783 RepID=UPI0007C76698|nr:hypothetical protein [Streptacidiphilus rugosus]